MAYYPKITPEQQAEFDEISKLFDDEATESDFAALERYLQRDDLHPVLEEMAGSLREIRYLI